MASHSKGAGVRLCEVDCSEVFAAQGRIQCATAVYKAIKDHTLV